MDSALAACVPFHFMSVWVCVFGCAGLCACLGLCVALCECLGLCECADLCACVGLCECVFGCACVGLCVCVCVCTHRSEEGLLDLLGEDVEHVHSLGGQGQVGARHPLVLGELRLPGLLLLLGGGRGDDDDRFFLCSRQVSSPNISRHLVVYGDGLT